MTQSSSSQTPTPTPSPIITNTRTAIESSVQTIVQAENSFIKSYNDTANEVNKSIDSFKSMVCQARRQYGREMIAGAAVSAFVVTLPFSRFAAFRNGLIAGLGAGYIVAPATTVGLVLQAKHSIENSSTTVNKWTSHGKQAVGDKSQ